MSAAPAEEDAGADVVSQCIGLLSRKDDTSRFVGLAMMLSIAQRVSEPAIVLESCAKALNPVFLDRLLKAGA